jgi:hypothetical protein
MVLFWVIHFVRILFHLHPTRPWCYQDSVVQRKRLEGEGFEYTAAASGNRLHDSSSQSRMEMTNRTEYFLTRLTLTPIRATV